PGRQRRAAGGRPRDRQGPRRGGHRDGRAHRNRLREVQGLLNRSSGGDMSHPPVGPEGFTPSVPSQPAPAPLPQASTPPNAPPPGTPYQVPPQSAVPSPTDQVSYAPGSAAV